MNLTKTLTLLVATTTCSLAFATKPKDTKESATPTVARETASLKSREELGARYLSIAHELAEVRAKGEVCEYDAYATEVLSLLKKARAYDLNIKPTTTINEVLKNSLAYRLTLAGPESLRTSSSYPDIFSNTEFYTQASGAYGYPQWIKLLPNGKAEDYRLELLDDAPYARWIKSDFTWKYKWVADKGATLIFTMKHKGKDKTYSYRINMYGDDMVDAGLVPANKDNKMRNSLRGRSIDFMDVKFFSIVTGECEA